MNNSKIYKTASKIKEQILARFDSQADYKNSDFKNNSKIIHFDDLTLERKSNILGNLELNKFELPVIISTVSNDHYLVLTTENFHYFENGSYEKLPLSDFDWGTTDEDEINDYYEEREGIIAKEEGHIIKFHLYRKENKDFTIKITSGGGLFAFWNTLRVVELVGRKYIIEDYVSSINDNVLKSENMIGNRIIEQLKFCIDKGKTISFLVGAGISAESGIPTFRGKDGYWVSGSKNYKAQDIGTFRMFNLASQEVWKWFLFRKSITERAKPNQSHIMLKEIEVSLKERFALISQNVDSLHRKAGNSEERTFLIHGDFDFVRCGDECSKELYPFPKEINLENRNKDLITEQEWKALRCPKCGEDLRPHVLWFDEYYDEKYFKRDSVLKISKHTGILFILGTSGATTLPQKICENVLAKGGMIVEVNIEESYFSELLKGKKKGIVLREKSSPFLTELNDEIKKLVLMAHK